MKTIYTAIISRLKEKVTGIKWIDLDTGQLDTVERPPVMLPCALISIAITQAKSITDTLQDCTATVTVTLAFDTLERTSANAPETTRNASLAAYDTIADVYAALQGWGTVNFDSLSRTRQQKENNRHNLFKYRIDFSVQFEDATAEVENTTAEEED